MQFRDEGLGFSVITVVQAVFVEEERSREIETQALRAIQGRQESGRSGLRARATRM